MKIQTITTSVLLTLLACGQSAIAAKKVDYVNIRNSGINPGQGKVYIKPINGNYGQATKSTTPYYVEMKAGCKGRNVLKQTFVAFGSENANGSVIESSGNYRKGVGAYLKKTLPWKAAAMKVPLTKLGVNPAALCQSYLNKKISQGVSRQQVLNSDHTINRNVTLSAVARCGKLGKSNDKYKTAKMSSVLKITCKAGSVSGINSLSAPTPKPTPPPGSYQQKAHVTSMQFHAAPKQISSTCPTFARFSGKISLSGPGMVKYKIVFPNNKPARVRVLRFNKAGTRNITAKFRTSHSIANDKAVLELIPPTKKAFAYFSVNCIAAGGPKSINSNSGNKSGLKRR